MVVWLLFWASRKREIPSRLASSLSYGEEIDQHSQDRDRPRRKVPGPTRETLEPQVPGPDMERDAGRHSISGRTMRCHVKRKHFGYRAHRPGRRDRVPVGKCRGRAFETLCVPRASGDCLATGVIASHWRAFTRSIRQNHFTAWCLPWTSRAPQVSRHRTLRYGLEGSKCL
jgi:hypothetical protein